MEAVQCKKADLTNEADAAAVLHILRVYACDIMGGGEDLPEYTQENLIPELRKRSHIANVFLAYVDGKPAGLAICFEGFSTFSCQPLLNIHDFAVDPAFRRRGVGSTLLFYVEQYARNTLGCCKLTLEVLQGNHGAQALYKSAGFGPYELDPEAGQAFFWQKKLE